MNNFKEINDQIENQIIENKKEELRKLEQARFDRLVQLKTEESPEGTDELDIITDVIQDEMIRKELN